MPSGRIEPGLFKRIKGLGWIIPDLRGKLHDKDRITKVDELRLADVRDNLATFIKNFMIQFFFEGYHFEIESLSEVTHARMLNAFHPVASIKMRGMIRLKNLLHVLCLVTGSVVSEEDDSLRASPLGVLEEVGEVEPVLPAPPLSIGVEDEPVPFLLGPDKGDERVPPVVVPGSQDPPLLPSRHPFCLDLGVEGEPGLVLERYENPFFRGLMQHACSVRSPSSSS
jgi:hypothetical protein